ncbi:hypothetical protein [Deinococcus radiotolerans]|uniref:Integrase n=1 Tax=Deinococcus radiotolerans TaxID=1309407 RepID=A0ABQ2FNA3_9DEIO|nr:hypothetical protein [Deinococcus radiotolerans]GGL10881.1 hypothetical protein GCM10010844_31960 [Deinococcus radiotolerans]
MVHPADEQARTLTHALHTGDLDTLVSTLHAQGILAGRPAQLISNLRPIVTAAQRDYVSLLRPPADFHAWLSEVLLINADGTPAKPNTRTSRVLTLRALYRALRHLGVIQGDPLLDFHSPAPERRTDPLPPRETLAALVHAARSDAALHAALLLLWHHAVPVASLLRIKWAAFNPQGRTLLRGDVVSPLTPEAATAVERLHHRAGYNPLFDGTLETVAALRIFPYDSQDALRLRILQVTRHAELPFIPPGALRRAALRDHAQSATHLGYLNRTHYDRVVQFAQAVAHHDPAPAPSGHGPAFKSAEQQRGTGDRPTDVEHS